MNSSFRTLALLLVIVQIFNAGCIHTQTAEQKTVEIQNTNNLTEQKDGPLTLASLIYTPSKMPLSDFFRRFKRGEFKEAFQRIDLHYKASNNHNEALERVIDEGFVPVYIEVENTGDTPIHLDEENFSLDKDPMQVKAISSEDLPHEFKAFNPSSVAANIANVGMIVGACAALIAAAYYSNGHAQIPPTPVADRSSGGTSPADTDDLFNPTTKVTRIDYKNYLFSSIVLRHGEKAKGLVFFKLPEGADAENFSLAMNIK